ncbi:MAG: phage portal protein [Flavobacterium sp.]
MIGENMNFKRKETTRADTRTPMAIFLNSEDAFPVGYRPLSKCEEIIRCANIIADMVSSMTIMLMQNKADGDIRVKNELSKKIDVNPCNYMNRKNFIFKIVKDMVMTGNSVVWPDVGTYINSLEPLRADYCSYRSCNGGYLIDYGGKLLDPNEVLHFVLVPDLKEPFKGGGYKEAIMSAVQTLAQANATKKGFLKSKWKPSMIISVNSDSEEFLDEDKRNKLLGSYTGTTEAGEPWVIPAGELDIKTISPLTLKDLAIQESITLDIKTIASAIGIPPFMVGIGDFNKDAYNNFVSTKIMAIAQIVQQEMSNKLLVSSEMYFKFNQKSLMQYELSEHMEFVKGMVGGGMLNRNEGRSEFDYSPVDKKGMNDYIVLENYIPVEKVGDQKKLEEGKKK